jgi:4-amino-4-deoxy-L-arabinose transferase-like glycosyltransferase
MSPSWLVVVLLLAIGTRAVSFQGYAGSDDAAYAWLADRLTKGEFPLRPIGCLPQYPQRLGVIVPTAASFALFGPREWALLIFPVGVSLGSIALAFWAARRMFDTRAGLFAAGLLAVVPIDCRFATWLLTDAPGALWAAAGILLIYAGEHRQDRKIVFGAAAGICFGLSWLTRMSVAYLAPFVGGYLLYTVSRDRRNGRLFGAVAAGSVAVFAAECLLYAIVHGDALHRFHAAAATYGGWFLGADMTRGWGRGEYYFELVKRLVKDGPVFVLLNYKLGMIPFLGLVSVLHSLWTRDRKPAFVACWFLFTVLMYNFGTVNLKHYQPLRMVDAYLYPMLFPGCVLGGYWLSRMLRRGQGEEEPDGRERQFWGLACAGVVAVACAWGLMQNMREGIGSPVEREIATRVAPQDRLFTDPRSIYCLRFFWGYPENMAAKEFTGMKPEAFPAPSRVLINLPRVERMRDLKVYEAPPFVYDPPKHWRKVWEAHGGALYELEAAPDDASPAKRSGTRETAP